MSLAEARDKRNEAKKLLAMDPPQDPGEVRQNTRRQAFLNASNTFEAIARDYVETKRGEWSDKYIKKVMRCYELHVFKYIGTRPASNISPPELLECLKKIQDAGHGDTAHRAKALISQAFKFGIITGRCSHDPSYGLETALKKHKVRHYPSIKPTEIPKFLEAVKTNNRIYSRTRRAIRLSLLVFVRPAELCKAEWSEFDLENAMWSIPADKMKLQKPHMVPLSRQALEILREQWEETGHTCSPYVFPNQARPAQSMSSQTVMTAIKRIGYKGQMSAHGFRALARTALDEVLGWRGEVVERQLAHKTKNALGEAYDRAQYLDQRVQMMQEWADHIDKLQRGEVIKLADFRRPSMRA